MAGQEVVTLVNEARSAGTHSVKFSAASIPSGAYTLVVRSNGLAVSAAVTVSK
jgi:hypothetical protein